MVDYCKLKWIKNIKHQYGSIWAYEACNKDSKFHLHWKTKTNARKPQRSDLILLGQRGKFTHLVEVIDDEPNSNSDKISLDFPFYREVKVLWKAPIFEDAPSQNKILKFRIFWPGGKASDLDHYSNI